MGYEILHNCRRGFRWSAWQQSYQGTEKTWPLCQGALLGWRQNGASRRWACKALSRPCLYGFCGSGKKSWNHSSKSKILQTGHFTIQSRCTNSYWLSWIQPAHCEVGKATRPKSDLLYLTASMGVERRSCALDEKKHWQNDRDHSIWKRLFQK